VGPNGAFLLLIFGLLGVYCEFIWPGRIVPGVVGAALAVAGAYFLFRGSLQITGVVLLGIGVLLLVTEALGAPYFLLGALGTVALTAGFGLLLPGSRRIAPGLAVPVSLLFGVLTTLLGSIAKRARRNKRAGAKGPN
jgi:membrane-bound serine protease (ClpP class)